MTQFIKISLRHWIIHQSWIILKAGSSLVHHESWIITESTISIKWCYLSILLVTGSSTEPTLFHAGCRSSLQVGLLFLQHLYLTMGGTHPINHVRKEQHLYLTMGGTHPINHVRKAQQLHLTMGGTHPINHVRKA